MDHQRIGEIWKLAISSASLFEQLSEKIIERAYRVWLREGDVAVDAGANVGRHLFPLAQAVGAKGKVHAFEPVPSLGERLRARISKEQLEGRINLRQAAVSDFKGVATFNEVTDAQALSGLRLREGLANSRPVSSYETPVLRLDDELAGQPIRFVKIDVEGAEFSVFKGAVRLMETARPVFAFEDGRGGSAKLYNYTLPEFYKFFADHGYEVLDVFGLPTTAILDRYPGPWNFFAVPIESRDARDTVIYANMYEIWLKLSELQAK